MEHFSLVASYAERDLDDQLTIDAICMRLSSGIEVLAQLDPATRDAMFADSWADMWGMRNRIAHGYLLVNPEIVRQTVRLDVPSLIDQVSAAMPDGEV